MKNTKTIMREAGGMQDEYEYYADAERKGEISRNTYLRACAKAGLPKSKAIKCLKHNYELAGLGHLI